MNGACIPRDYVCDGDYDCVDRTDETNCGKFSAPVSHCIHRSCTINVHVVCKQAWRRSNTASQASPRLPSSPQEDILNI